MDQKLGKSNLQFVHKVQPLWPDPQQLRLQGFAKLWQAIICAYSAQQILWKPPHHTMVYQDLGVSDILRQTHITNSCGRQNHYNNM